MNSLPWTLCFLALMLLAVVDLAALRRAGAVGAGDGRAAPPARGGIFSPFTLACQAAFAVFAALHIGPLAFDGFDSASAVLWAELVFLALMLVGALSGRRRASV